MITKIFDKVFSGVAPAFQQDIDITKYLIEELQKGNLRFNVTGTIATTNEENIFTVNKVEVIKK